MNVNRDYVYISLLPNTAKIAYTNRFIPKIFKLDIVYFVMLL